MSIKAMIVLLLLLPAMALGQTSKIQAQWPEKDSWRAGEIVDLVVKIQHPLDTTLVMPEELGSSRFVPIDQTQTTVPSESGLRTEIKLKYGLFRPGIGTLGPLTFKVVDQNDQAEVLSTPEFKAKVLSNFENEEPTLSPPQPLASVWQDDYTLLWVAGGTLVALLGGLIGFYSRRRQRLDEEIYVPARPAHEVALEKLSALQSDTLLSDGLHMLFYVRMSEALREYLGRRFGFPGTELTTTEILERLESVEWPRGLELLDIKRILEHCDLVKFGGYLPTDTQANETLTRCFTVVELTKPIETAATEEAA